MEITLNFGKGVKPLFSDKQKYTPKDIILVENDNKDVAEKLNSFFISAVDKLEIESFLIENSNNISEDLQEFINKYDNHPSIIKIKENVRIENDFTFKDMTTLDFEKEILKLDTIKANIQGDIPAKILIKTYDIISNYNKAKQEHKYPTSLKMGVVSKLFERNM